MFVALGRKIEGIRDKGRGAPWERRLGRVHGNEKSSSQAAATPDAGERVPMRSEKMRNTEFSNLTVRTVRW